MLVELQGRNGKFRLESTHVTAVWSDSDDEVGVITTDCGPNEYYPIVGKEKDVVKVLGFVPEQPAS
jgi:hypothetical protein